MKFLKISFSKINKLRRIIKFSLLVFGIIFLLFLADFIFYLYHPSPALTRFFINRSVIETKRSNIQAAVNYLAFDAKIKLVMMHNKYPKLIPSRVNSFMQFPKDKELDEDISNYLINLSNKDVNEDEDSGLSKIYYTLGIIAFNNNKPELAKTFFQIAVYLNPGLSSYHVELANFYLLKNDLKNSDKTLKYCNKFSSSRTHCQQYRTNNYQERVGEEVGFLRSEVEQHYREI